MKRIFLITAAALFGLTHLTHAANGNPDKTSRKQQRKERRDARRELWLHSPDLATENQFDYDFPRAKDIGWNRGVFEEATFTDNGVTRTAFYDEDHDLVGTTNTIEFTSLPAKARQYIDKKYPGYTVERTLLFDDNEANETDMILFNHAFEDEDTYFAMLSKGKDRFILQIALDGRVSFFTRL
jgi:hypothetical protein